MFTQITLQLVNQPPTDALFNDQNLIIPKPVAAIWRSQLGSICIICSLSDFIKVKY